MSLSLVVLTVIALSACGKKGSDRFAQETAPAISDMVESSLNTIGGAGDDASNETVSATSTRSKLETMLAEAFLPKDAWAASCTRTLSGSAGTCTRDVNCEWGPYTWGGQVALTFSNGTSCLNPSIANPGDYFTRTANFSIAGPRGSIATISSAHENYLGETISGGSKVTRQGDGSLAVDVLGVSKVLKLTGQTDPLMDVSFKTAQPLTMNQLRRNGRVVTGGSLVIQHNRARYSATHTYSAITWGEAGCCYPTSGTIDIAFSEGAEGSAQVVFNGCGSFSVTSGENSASFSLANCE
ncbi:MAG TPA: hypothetical protein VM598_07205 [Bdellovibrionota bacterium]|nr:hypothetical protein [Bdellovibrionota bacterium]